MISIIVAASTNMVIGNDNDLPWNLPTDMKHFKETTNGHTVIMGRKCWESIPEKYRPLPNRKNIVVTRDKDYVAVGAEAVTDLNKLLLQYKDTDETAYVIGGAEIYKEAFKYAKTLWFTRIQEEVGGNVTLKGFKSKDWKLINQTKDFKENDFTFWIEFYKKKI